MSNSSLAVQNVFVPNSITQFTHHEDFLSFLLLIAFGRVYALAVTILLAKGWDSVCFREKYRIGNSS